MKAFRMPTLSLSSGRTNFAPPAPSFASSGETPATEPVNPEPLRVLVQEVPAPGEAPRLESATFDDARSIAAARKSRPGGYLRLPIAAAKELGAKAVLLSKVLNGTDLVLRVRLFPTPYAVR